MGPDTLGEAGVRVRAFFGLPLPEEHREALRPFILRCTALAPKFRWTPVENLHFTIRFLGHLDVSAAEAMANRLSSAGLEAFAARLGEIGSFKRGRLASVIWIGLHDGEQPMAALAARVEEEAVRSGLEAENRKFHAHLTLARARLRDGAAMPQLASLPVLPEWQADELILYQSHLGRGGSVYEPLRRLRLR